MRFAFHAGIPFLALLVLAACGAPVDIDVDGPGARYTIMVETEGEGRISSIPPGLDCGETCNARFDAGTEVTLRAEPDDGHRLARWGGACAGAGGSTCFLTMNHDAGASATFEAIPIAVPEPGPGDPDEPPSNDPPEDDPPTSDPPEDDPPADEPPANDPSVILVTSDAGDTGGPDCTLRDAITAANTDASAGGCPAGSGADVIRLETGLKVKLVEPHVADGDGPVGLPPVTSEIEILGEGATIERTSMEPFRILTVAAGGDLILRNATLTGGSGRADEAPGEAGFVGAGVLNRGKLVLDEVVLRGNLVDRTDTTFDGFDPPAPYGAGGGLFNEGDATLRDTSVLDNDALRGGGIYNAPRGSLRLIRSTVARNESWGHGAGIATWGALDAVNATISSNYTHNGFGAAIYLYSDVDAGTSTGEAGSAELEHVSIVGNGGTYASGAIETVGRARVTLFGVILSQNTSDSTVQITCDGRGEGSFVSLGYNVVAGSHDSPGACGLNPTTDVAISDPSEDDDLVHAGALPLADNDGPTRTNALEPSSPAVDLIPASDDGCTLPRDQRLVKRPQGEACDAGAFELEQP